MKFLIIKNKTNQLLFSHSHDIMRKWENVIRLLAFLTLLSHNIFFKRNHEKFWCFLTFSLPSWKHEKIRWSQYFVYFHSLGIRYIWTISYGIIFSFVTLRKFIKKLMQPLYKMYWINIFFIFVKKILFIVPINNVGTSGGYIIISKAKINI